MQKYGERILEHLDINTIDGFQGQEKDIIIVSCVRANKNSIGFLSDKRRLNVCLTRAKHSLWIIANSDCLSISETWADLVNDSKQRKMFKNLHVTDDSIRIC